MNYLIFDTETTGLPLTWNAPVHKLSNWPRMVQLAWILYDEQGKEQMKCSRIIQPEGFSIPPGAVKIHGITTEMALRDGKPLTQVLQEFCTAINRDNLTLVAHNMAFDEKIVGAELLRMNLESNFFKLPKICTMKSTIDFCNLPKKKYPKLGELYYILFNSDFQGAHRADSDVLACGRCFFELKRKRII